VNNPPTGEPEPIAWHTVAARQQQHNITLIRTALGDVGELDAEEEMFIDQTAWNGGHLQLASLLHKARQATPIDTEQPENPAGDTASQMINDHVNDIGDWCPWSDSPVDPATYPHTDGRCPQACRASRLVERQS
jgi:hypothetical protein